MRREIFSSPIPGISACVRVDAISGLISTVAGGGTTCAFSNGLPGNCLRNTVESRIFRTGQKILQVYESAALTAELRALRALML